VTVKQAFTRVGVGSRPATRHGHRVCRRSGRRGSHGCLRGARCTGGFVAEARHFFHDGGRVRTSVRLVSLLSRFARAPENAARRRAIPSSTSGAAAREQRSPTVRACCKPAAQSRMTSAPRRRQPIRFDRWPNLISSSGAPRPSAAATFPTRLRRPRTIPRREWLPRTTARSGIRGLKRHSILVE
jgi:hypothetical protein